MKVRECMCKNVQYVNPETTVQDVAKLMQSKHIGCVAVCNTNKNIVGLVTDRDLILRSLACDKDIKETPISEVMTTNIYKTTPEADSQDVVRIMCDSQVRRVPVVENGTLVGIVTLGDLANNSKINNKEAYDALDGICRCGKDTHNNE